MPRTKRTTVYLRPQTHRALKMKAARSDRTISEIVDEAVSQALREDEMDIATLRERAGEPTRPFEEFVRELRRERRL